MHRAIAWQVSVAGDAAGDRRSRRDMGGEQPGEPVHGRVGVGVGEHQEIAARELDSRVAGLLRQQPRRGPGVAHHEVAEIERRDELGAGVVGRAVDEDDLEITLGLAGERAQAAAESLGRAEERDDHRDRRRGTAEERHDPLSYDRAHPSDLVAPSLLVDDRVDRSKRSGARCHSTEPSLARGD